MQRFNITVEGAGALDGVYRDVPATAPAVALKRVLDGGFSRHYKWATVDPDTRARLRVGGRITVQIQRFK